MAFNYQSDAACNTVTYTVSYTGFQFPIPTPNISTIQQGTGTVAISVSTAQQPFGTNLQVWELSAFTCYNPNASAAYFQVIDSNTAALGSNEVYEAGIPASSTFEYNGPPILGTVGLVIGATTASRGNTAVATPLACTVQGGSVVSFLNGLIPGS